MREEERDDDVIHVLRHRDHYGYEADGRHHTPHIHARFAEFECSIDFEGRVFDGRFPPRKLALLRAWIVLHQEELEADWKLMSEGLAAFRIDPLR